MIFRNRRDSVGGGGVAAEFFRDPQKPTRFSGGGGGSSRYFQFIFSCFFRYAENKDFLLKKRSLKSNCPNSVRFSNISVRPGDQE